MFSWPFDSHITGKDPETQLPLMDRAVDSKTLQLYNEKMFTSGIMPNIERNFDVKPATGMQVIVNRGVCMVGGAIGISPRPRTMTIQASEQNLDRIDTIVIRKDNTDNYRSVDLYVKKGTPSLNPTPAELQRPQSVDEPSEVFEIALAYIMVVRKTTAISLERITDTRFNGKVCGVSSPYNTVDTTGLFAQYQAEFDKWFNGVKGQLSTDVAGNLQNQINTIKENVVKTESEFLSTKNTDAVPSVPMLRNYLKSSTIEFPDNIGEIRYTNSMIKIGKTPSGKNVYLYAISTTYPYPQGDTKDFTINILYGKYSNYKLVYCLAAELVSSTGLRWGLPYIESTYTTLVITSNQKQVLLKGTASWQDYTFDGLFLVVD